MGVVQQGGAHADQAVVPDDRAVDDGVVAHRNVVADDRLRRVLRLVVDGVEHYAVLDVRAVADDDPVHIAAQYGVVPDRTVAADGHVAQNDGRFGQKGVLSDHRLMPADFSYKRHI